jgi:uncharacterized repeat protein (TIGR01451 family)
VNRRKPVVVVSIAALALWGLVLVMALVSTAALAQPIDDPSILSSVVAHSSASALHQVSSSPVYTRPLDRPQAQQTVRDASVTQSAPAADGIFAGTDREVYGLLRDEPLAPPMPGSDELAVSLSTDRVWGFIGAGEIARVQVNGAQMGADTATALGFFWTTLYDASGDRPDLVAGDVITLTHGATAVGHTLRAIDAQINPVSNVVSGTIGSVTTPLSVTVYIGGGGEPSTRSISRTVNTDAAGHFSIDTTAWWGINAGDRVMVGYHENGWEVHRHVSPVRSLLVLPTPWRRVEGFAAPNSAVTVTVYLSNAVTIKETVTPTARVTNRDDGYYSVDLGNPLNISDIVTARFADGVVLTRTITPLSLNLDVVNDRLTGQAPPGTVIQGMSGGLFPPGWQDVVVSTTVTASGYYTVNFSGKMDLLPGVWAGVITSDAAGNDLQLWRPSPYIEVNQTWDDVSGWGSYAPIEAENKPVTLTVYSTASHSTSTYASVLGTYDHYQFNNNNFSMPDIQPGDVLTVTDGVWTGIISVTTNTVLADTQLDRITGSIVPPSNYVEVAGWDWQDYLYPINGSFNVSVTATPFFTVTLSGFDLRDNVTYGALHRTSAGYVDWRSRETGGFGVYPWWNSVQANFVDPNVPYTLTLYDNGGAFKGQLTGTSQYPNGNVDWRSFGDVSQQIQPGDRVQVQAANGYSRSITITDVSLNFDPINRIISGTAPANARLGVEVYDFGSGWISTDDSGQFRLAIAQLQDVYNRRDIGWGDGWYIRYVDSDGTWVRYEYQWPQILAHYDKGGGNDVWGNNAFPGNTIAVTISRPGTGVIFTGTTHTGTCNWCDARGYEIPLNDNTLRPNDRVTVDFGDGFIDTMDVLTMTGAANAATDIFTTTAPLSTSINANANSPTAHWESWWNHSQVIVGASGFVTFNLGLEGFDIVPGTDFTIHSQQTHGHNTQYSFHLPRNVIEVNYAHDWVGVDAEPNSLVTLTRRSALGDVNTYLAQIDASGRLNNTDNNLWNPPNPDIQPGDSITATGAGLLAVVNPIGTVNGTLNVAADTISGTINAPFGSTPLMVRCEVWVNNGPGIEVNDVPANGGSYSCNFNSTWDIVPGQDVAVRYVEPDGDTVINVFRGPAPDVRIEKWPEGGGQAQAGGSVIFTLRYRNEGNAVANNVRLTDTLPSNTSYLTDSSKLPHTLGTGTVVWNLGTLQPGAFVQFQIVLTNTANSGDVLTNQADISTSSLGDPDYNNHAEATVNVGSGQPDLSVNKYPNPGNPTPGQNFNYQIDYGNKNGIASGPVRLTDTLPLSTSLVSWSSRDGYNLWTAVITTGGKLVLQAPTVPGSYGDQIVLTVRLDSRATYGTQLTNTVEIATAGDADPNNNQYTHSGTRVDPPRYAVSLNKSWGHGSLALGQHANYWLNLNNNGNMPAPNVAVTDVLPAGVTFITSALNLGQGNEVPYPPTSISGNVLRWDVGTMPVADNRDVRVELAISPALAAGTVLTNCATIATSAIEHDPHDNAACTTDAARPAGPNLRVIQYARWNNPNRVRYDVQIANIGSQTIQNVHLTNTLPVSMSISWWGFDFWEQWSGNRTGNQITLTLTRLEPNWTTYLHIDADVPDVPNRTFFTSTARIDTPAGDVYPQDNTSTSVIGTGPDLTIAKWQSGGAVKAGQLLTYTLHFKNDSQWWTNGNVWVSDTLPVSVTFVSVQQRDCWDTLFCSRPPDNSSGRTLGWNFSQWGNGQWNDLIVTVRVANTLPLGAIFTNTATVASDQPVNDREPNTVNNLAVSVLRAPFYQIYLPLIVKQ